MTQRSYLQTIDLLDRETSAAAIELALSSSGFISLRNHGIDFRLRDRLFEIGHQLFDLPDTVKAKYFVPKNGGLTGYLRVEGDPENKVNIDAVDMWHCGKGIHPPNVWPSELAELELLMTRLYDQYERCTQSLLELCSLAMGAPRDRIPSMVQNGWSTLRLMRYGLNRGNQVVGKAHADTSLLSFLASGTADGLEIQSADGEFHSVETGHEDLIVAVGEMFSSLTNGYFKCGIHRIRYPRDQKSKRITLIHFVSPRPEVNLAPLSEGLVRTGVSSQYEKLTTSEMLAQRLGLGIGV